MVSIFHKTRFFIRNALNRTEFLRFLKFLSSGVKFPSFITVFSPVPVKPNSSVRRIRDGGTLDPQIHTHDNGFRVGKEVGEFGGFRLLDRVSQLCQSGVPSADDAQCRKVRGRC